MTIPAAVPPNNEVLYPKRWIAIALWIFPIAILAAGYAIDHYAWPGLMEWLSLRNGVDPTGAPFRHGVLLAVIIGSMAATGMATAGYLWFLGLRILRTQLFPPRGLPIIAPTKVLRGAPASRKAAEFLLFGTLALVLTGYVIWALFSIFPETKNLLRSLYG